MNLSALHEFQAHISSSALRLEGNWTPHRLMDCLKERHPKSGKASQKLTRLGAFLNEALPRRMSESLKVLKWVTFHLDYPGRPFGVNESDIRNWIAIQQQDQGLIDCVHWETIRLPTEQLEDMYAPSLIARRLRDLTSGRKNWINKRWLFRATSHTECKVCQHIAGKKLQAKVLDSNRRNTLCFSPQISASTTQIPLDIRSCDPSEEREISITLGALLGEEEELAARNFANFANLVLDVPGNTTGLRANYYYRIPKQWPGEESYLTEICAAFMDVDPQAKSVFALLEPLNTVLSNVVALINSEVAFQIGKQRQQLSQIGEFHRCNRHYKHTVNNLSPTLSLDLKHAAEALDRNDTTHATRNVSDATKANDILTMVYTCSLGSYPKTIETIPSMLHWLAARLSSSAAEVQLTISTEQNHAIPNQHRHAAFLIVWNLWYNAVTAQTNYNERKYNSTKKKLFCVKLELERKSLLLTFTNNPAIDNKYVKYLSGEAAYPFKDSNAVDERGLEIVSFHAQSLSWTIRAEVFADTTTIKVDIPMPKTSM